MFRSLCKIRDLLKESFGSAIRAYLIDDPALVPQSELPCLCVCPISTNIGVADTQRDLYTHTIDIILIINAKQELKKYKEEIVGTQFMTEIMEKRDTTTGVLQANTILYVLRANLRLGSNWEIGNISDIDYVTRTRGAGAEQFMTKEATCRLTVTEFSDRT